MLETRNRSLALLVSLLAASLLLFGASAVAGTSLAKGVTIDYGGGVITVTGTAGDDSLLFSYGDEGYGDAPHPAPTDLIEIAPWTAATLTAGAIASGCEPHEWEGEVWVCPRPSKIIVNLLGGDDSLSTYEDTSVPFTVPFEAYGGPGNDTLDGASGNDTLYGGDGDDALTGRDGHDRLFGEAGKDVLNGDFGDSGPGGNDYLDGGAGDDEFEKYVGYGYPASLKGDDTYIGGPGHDSFSYFNRSDPVNISLDGVANDGMAGERDNIHPDIEEVGGSSGNDVIVGSPGPDHLWGGEGNDRIFGGGGNDKLSGDNGDDHLDGGPGDDVLDGGCMTDTLIGGPGRDSFNSDGNCHSSTLRSTLDRIEARDGERDELIFCQRDTDPAGDRAVVDPVDPVTNTGAGACKEILVGSASAGGGGSPGGVAVPGGKVRARFGPNLRLIVGSGKKRAAAPQRIVLRQRRLLLGTLFATRRTVVTAAVSVRKGRRTISLGRRKLVIPARRSKPVSFALSRRAIAAVRGSKRVVVAANFRVGKKTYRKKFRVAVKRR